MSEPAKLRFIHLSDIHFSNRAATFGFDPDKAIRDAITHDVTEQVHKLGGATAILISGDIAYAGKPEEYDSAAEWLEQLWPAAKCDDDAIFLCPGNHDIDRSVIQANPLIQDGHDAVRRGTDFTAKDVALTQRLVQPQAKLLFYAPMMAYNKFAARYECEFYADSSSFVWENDFILNDGSTLRLRGLNTALLSGLADVERSLFLGSRAWTLPVHTGVEYMTMAHHPPSWLADGKNTEIALESARIQLFGHEHDQRIQPGRDWIKLYAGAVNPHRAEPNWRPGYNIIEVWVEGDASRKLRVDVHAREWQGRPPQFRSIEDRGHQPVHSVEIALPDLPQGWAPTVSAPAVDDPPAKEGDSGGVKEAAPMSPQSQFRHLVYRFFRLSLSKKTEIVGTLRLAEESDSVLPDVERFKRSLLRAKESGKIQALETLLDQLEKQR